MSFESFEPVGPSATPLPDAPSLGGEVSKGFSRGLRDTGASALQGLGMGAEYFGQNATAKFLRGSAKGLRDSAAQPQFTPEVPDFEHAHGFGQTARWAAGKAGEMGPVVGAAAAGGLVGGFPGAMATMVPGQFGAIDQGQQANPELAAQPISSRMGDAVVPALASSALMSLPGESIIGKLGLPASKSLLGAAASNIGKGAAIGGATMGGSDALVQQGVNPNAPTDWGQAGDAALGGAVAVGGLHAVHAIPSYLKGSGQSIGGGLMSIKDRAAAKLAAAKTGAGDAVDAAAATAPGVKVKSLSDGFMDLAQKGKAKFDDTISSMMAGKPVGVSDADLAAATPEQAAGMMAAGVQKAKDFVAGVANRVFADPASTPDAQRQASAAMDDPGSQSSQMWAAGLAKTQSVGQAAMGKINELRDSFNQGRADAQTADAQTADTTTKQSADYSGANKAIADQLGPLLERSQPELASSPQALGTLADGLRQAVTDLPTQQLSSDTLFRLIDALGPDTVPTLRKAWDVLGDPAKAEGFYQNLNDIGALQARTTKLKDFVGGALTESSQKLIHPDEFGELTQMLVNRARGVGVDPNAGPHQQAADDASFRNFMAEHFGDKADAVSLAIEKEAGMDKDGTPVAPRTEGEYDANGEYDVNGAYDANGDRLEAAPTDVMKFGLTPPDAKGNSRSVINGLAMPEDGKYARQHLLDLKAAYPEHDVKFERLPGSDHGHITVEQRADPGKFSAEDLAGMAHDTKKYPNSPSRINVEGHALDAMRIASVMDKKLPRGAHGESYALRTANMFKEGIAQLNEQFRVKGEEKTRPALDRSGNPIEGRKPIDASVEGIKVPDSAVIGRIGGKPFTWGEAKKLHGDTAENRMSPKDQARLAELRKEYMNASDDIDKADIKREADDLIAKEHAKGEDIVGRERAKPIPLTTTAEGRPASAIRTPSEAVGTTRADNGTETEIGKALEPSKDAEIHSAAKEIGKGGDAPLYAEGGGPKSAKELQTERRDTRSNEDLVNRGNMDGTPHHVSDRIPKEQGKERNALTDAVYRWADRGGAGVSKLVERTRTLLANADKMTAADQRRLTDLAGKKPSEASPVVNDLARKYKDRIVAPKGERIGPELVPSDAGNTSEMGGAAYRPRKGEVMRDIRAATPITAEPIKSVPGSKVPINPVRFDKNGKVVGSADPTKVSTADRFVSAAKQFAVENGEVHRAVDAKLKGTATKAQEALIDSSFADAHSQVNKREAPPNIFTPSEAPKSKPKLLEAAIAKRQEYLDNPPKDYSTDVAKGHLDWAMRQKERVDAEYEKAKGGDNHDRQAELSDMRGSLKRLIDKAKSVLEGDASLKDFEGSTPDPKAVAAKKAAFLERAASGDPKLLKEIGVSTDAKGLQRAAEALPPGEASDAVNARLSELVKDPDVAYGLQTKKYSMKSAESTDPTRDNAKDYSSSDIKDHVTKVLGDTVRTQWANLTHAGEYSHAAAQGIIRLSVHALDPMSTAFHESFHAFLAQMRDAGAHDVVSAVEKAAASEHVLAQLNERFKGQPEVLKQLRDPEERAAYMYQMWAADPSGFKVSIAARGVFQKISDLIHRVMGSWTNDERALHILQYFNSGEYAKNLGSPSAVRHALMGSHRSQILEAAKTFTKPLAHLADAVLSTGGARLRDTGIPALSRLADIMKREGTTQGGDQGFVQAARVEGTKRMSALGAALEGHTPAHLNDAMEALQRGEPGATPDVARAVTTISRFLRDQLDYMKAAGVNVGDLGPDYFPRVWDTHYISKNQQAFRDMLEPYIRRGEMKGSADQLIRNLINRGGSEIGIESRETAQPGMQHTKERLLSFITPQDAAQFVSKDMLGTLSSYVTQATRKAEWTRRLGGGKLAQLLEDAKAQGATKEHLDLAETYMKGIDGTLGDTINPTLRRAMGNMIVYQNIRLLPTAAFSMLIDPGGVMVRGGTLGDAWKTFKRGMAGIPKTFNKEGGEVHDQATKWSELVGVVDSAMMSHVMGDIYTQGMVGGTAQKLNNAFFKYNMVEGLNRNFRIGATEASIKFLARHAGGLEGLGDSTHSERWMKELGLQKGDIVATKDGIALTTEEGLSAEQVQRVHAAINQWVDGAVLRPDAADKPIWMNDPHYALMSHLKQFIFSFQETILKRTMHELQHGNYTPAMALASYVPVMMAADFAKGVLVTGGGQPQWQSGWDLGDYLGYALQRAGLLGVGQFGMDVSKDLRHGGSGVGALVGPTIEQFGDAVQTLGGHKQFGNTAIDAMPANTFIKGWFDQGVSKADPMMPD